MIITLKTTGTKPDIIDVEYDPLLGVYHAPWDKPEFDPVKIDMEQLELRVLAAYLADPQGMAPYLFDEYA